MHQERETSEVETIASRGLEALRAGDFPSAIEHYRAALDQAPPASPDRRGIWRLNLARALESQGAEEAALDALGLATSELRQAGDGASLSLALRRHLALLRRRGAIREAIELALSEAGRETAAGPSDLLATLQLSLAELWADLGEIGEARDQALAGLDRLDRDGRLDEAARAALHLGRQAIFWPDIELARLCLLRAWGRSAAAGAEGDAIAAQLGLAHLDGRENPHAAAQRLERVQQTLSENDPASLRAILLSQQAALLQADGRTDEARACRERFRSAAAASGGAVDPLLAWGWLAAGAQALEEGDPGARADLVRALALLPERCGGPGLRDLRAQAHLGLAALYRQAGDLSAAADALSRARSELNVGGATAQGCEREREALVAALLEGERRRRADATTVPWSAAAFANDRLEELAWTQALAARLEGTRPRSEAPRVLLEGLLLRSGAPAGAVIFRNPAGREQGCSSPGGARCRLETQALLAGRRARQRGLGLSLADDGSGAAALFLELEEGQGRRLAPEQIGFLLRQLRLCLASEPAPAAAPRLDLDLLGAPRAESRRLLERAAGPPDPGSDDLGGNDRAGELVGQAPAFREALRQAELLARSPLAVLIVGESGTGKEAFARLLHRRSPRAAGRFVPLNAAACSDTLLEAELLGARAGAYSGLAQDREGLFAYADGGTLFLDEIGDTSPAFQAALLRLLEEGRYRPLGATEEERAQVRIVAATHRDPAALVREGRFRLDLQFRLGAVLRLPPLRERLEDLPALARHFLAGRAELTTEAQRALLVHAWPGNVRELRNVLAAALLHAREGRIDRDCLARVDFPPVPQERRRGDALGYLDLPWEDASALFQRLFFRRLLARHQGGLEEAARAAGVHRRSLQKILRRLDGSESERG